MRFIGRYYPDTAAASKERCLIAIMDLICTYLENSFEMSSEAEWGSDEAKREFLKSIEVLKECGDKCSSCLAVLKEARRLYSESYADSTPNQTDDRILNETFDRLEIEFVKEWESYRNEDGLRAINDPDSFLAQVINYIPDALFIKEAKSGRFVAWNRQCEQLLGYKAEDVLGRSDYDLFPKNEADFFREKDLELLRSRESLVVTAESVHSQDGNERIWRTVKTPLVDFHHDSAYILGIATDITEQKKSEFAFREAYEELKELELIIQNSPIVLFLVRNDEMFQIEYITETIKTFGYTRHDFFSGRVSFLDFVYYEDVSWVFDTILEAIKEKRKNFAFHFRVQTADGAIRWIDERVHLFFDSKGEVSHIQGVMIDITEQHQAKQALLESELKYKDLIDTTDTGCLIVDPNGCVEDANFEYVRMSGHDRLEDILGRSVLEWTAPDERDRNQEAMQTCLSDGRVRNFVVNYLTSDGLLTPVEVNANTIETENGVRLIAMCRDIHERRTSEVELEKYRGRLEDQVNKRTQEFIEANEKLKCEIAVRQRAEEEIRKKSETFHAVLQHAPYGVAIIDISLDGHVHFINNEFEKMLGYRLEDIPDLKTWHETAYPDSAYRAAVLSDWDRLVINDGVRQGIEYRVTCKDGTIKDVEFQGAAIGDEQLVVMLADHTALRQAENEREVRESYLRAFIQAIPDLPFILDENGKYIEVLVEKSDLLYREAGKLQGNLLHDVFPKEIADGFVDTIRRTLDTGSTQFFEYEIDVPAGRCWFEARTSVLEGVDFPSRRVIWMVRDITQRKNMEAQIRQQQKLESIGTLASGVAHEINNPLNIIMNFGELIVRRAANEEKVSKYASEIISESERIAGIVQNLLAFSRREKEIIKPAKLDEILEETLSLTRKVLHKDQISTHVDVEEKLPCVRCRRQQLMQVVMNLLTNARDALNQRYPRFNVDKQILITLRCYNKQDENWIRLTVEDHGCGIPEEFQERIFDPFFTSKSRAHGTGLGLSVSHGIMKEHGGYLSFESDNESFTRFHMDLKADPAK